MAKRVLGAAGAAILFSSLGVLAACSGADSSEGSVASAREALQTANVTISVFDASGNKVGEGAGVMLAPRLVLTSGHLIAGYAKWSATTADGKKTVMGRRGLTKDWMDYDSMTSHPRKTDVGVIYLDHAIDLPAYPKLATSRQSDGGAIERVTRLGNELKLVTGQLGHFRSFSHAYTTEIANRETLFTGGAVINDKAEIIGLVTGRGMQTGKLHVARTDSIVAWLSPKVVCAGGPKAGVPSSLGIKTYGTPGSSGADCDGGAGGGTSSSGGGQSSGGVGASSSGSGGGASSSGSSGSSGGADNCDDGGGNNWGDGGSGGSSSSGGLSSGNVGSSSGGSSGTGGSSGGTTSSSSGGSSSGGASSGNVGSSTSSSGGGTSSSGGTTGGSSSGGANGGNDGTSSSGGTTGGSSGGGDQCQGSQDNPDVCPPEPDGCTGPNCGGGIPDNTIDYGMSESLGGGGSPIIR